MKLGYGIFMWDGPERRTDRYGVVYLSDSNFDDDCSVKPEFDLDAAKSLVGKNVVLYCKVIENRPSGHAGDKFLHLMPETPEIGEIVQLGVGPCYLEPTSYSPSGMAIGIRPSDGRSKFWIDPRRFFRLHDQTVELYAEETDASESTNPTADMAARQVNYGNAISNGDGTIQFKTTPDQERSQAVKVLSKVENLGGGLFITTTPHANDNEGEAFPLAK